MGLFSFLSRKSRRAKAAPSLKPQPPPSTTSGQRPNQAGNPLTGDLTLVESLPRGRPDSTESDLSLDTASDDEVPAPAPSVPRFRDESPERPSTAPGARPSSIALPSSSPRVKRNGQKRPPPLSFRMARPETAVLTSRPGSRGSISSITSVFRRTSGHSRTNSLRSDGTKAFKAKDILDAQSEIKPADFRARVRAAGARDYGEDVAERNMGENGVQLGSEHVQAFYAQSRADEPDIIQSLSIGPPLSPHKAGVRRLSVRSSQYSLPRRISSQSPVPSSPKPSRAFHPARRRSVNTYMPPGSGDWGFLAPPSQDRLADPSPRTPVAEVDKLDFGFSALQLNPPAMPRLPEAAPAPIIRTNRLPRDSVELAKKRAEEAVADFVKHDSPATDFAAWSATRSRRSSTLVSAGSNHGKHRSLYTLRSPVSSSVLSRDFVAPATPLSYPSKSVFHNQRQEASESSARSDLASVQSGAAVSTLSAAPFKTHPAIMKIREEDAETPHPLSRRFSLAPAKEAISTADITLPDDEILDYPPPIRTRSMRGWSASSGTPTVSESTIAASITTSTFNRPPSLHTADTSVDLSVGNRSPVLKQARSITHDSDQEPDSDDNVRVDGPTIRRPDTECVDAFRIDEYLSCASACSSTPNDTEHHATVSDHNNNTTAHHERQPTEDTFNIDDYLSSDAEPLTAAASGTAHSVKSRRPTAEGEEELLFNESGYGAAGMQLPGLADLFGGGGGVEAAKKTPSGRRDGLRRVKRMSVPAQTPQTLREMPWEDVRSRSGLGLGLSEYWDGEGREGRGGSGGGAVKGKRMRTEGYRPRETRMKRFVLDAAADDDYDDDSLWEEDMDPQGGRLGAVGLDGDMSDGGYEADYVEDESEGASRRRQQGKKRARRMSMLHLTDKREEKDRRQQQGQCREEKDEPEQEEAMEGETVEDKVAAAVKLRKQIKRARRLAGQPSPAMLRRMEPRASRPALHVDGAE